MRDWRDARLVRPDGDAWEAPPAFRRPAGVSVVGLGIRATSPAGTTTVVLSGTVDHPDAPDGAWSTLWSGAVDPGTPARPGGPIYVGTVRWLRWVVTTESTPTPGSTLHLAIDGDLQE